MLVVSLREFRDKQSFFIDKAIAGESVILRNRKNQSIKLVPVTEDDALMSKEEFFAKLDKALQGKGSTCSTKEEILSHLENL